MLQIDGIFDQKLLWWQTVDREFGTRAVAIEGGARLVPWEQSCSNYIINR